MTSGNFRTARFLVCTALPAMFACSAQAALVISTDATQNVTCSGGVCSATAADAVLNVSDLTDALASAPLTIQSGSLAQDIQVEAPFSWTSSNALTLDSYRSIEIKQPISDAGPASFLIRKSHGSKRGDLTFGKAGKISFLSLYNVLKIDGVTYTLVGSIKNLVYKVKRVGGPFALASDYDASGDGIYTASPIGTFSGTFEGLGNAISNFSADVSSKNRPYEIGLFSTVTGSGILRDVGIINADVHGKPHKGGTYQAAILVAKNQGIIVNSYTSGQLYGQPKVSFAGGLVGENDGTIVNSWSSAKILDGYVGGLVGENLGVIKHSHASGSVIGNFGGGLAASNFDSAIIEDSYATGLVTPGGGLVGQNTAEVFRSFASGSVRNGGGLIYDSSGTVIDCYATGNIGNGSLTNVGGLFGTTYYSGIVTSSYAVGKVAGGNGVQYRGGVVGLDQQEGDQFFNTYWDLDTSGIKNPSQGAGNVSNDPGITGLTDAELKSGLPAGFDPNVWAEDPNINNGYPYLIANPPGK